MTTKNSEQKYINPDSDGRFYELNSMVKVGCQDCEGCFKCCQGMGNSILLDPYDMFQFRKSMNIGLEELIKEERIELGIYDGLILPHIKMTKDKEQCSFLDENGRCSIHAFRPGICRLFPLGRNFEDGKMNYILLSKACAKTNRTKIKIEKWLDITDGTTYHDYIIKWHDFKKLMSAQIAQADKEQASQFNLYLLNTFFTTSEVEQDAFYKEFDIKIQRVKKAFGF